MKVAVLGCGAMGGALAKALIGRKSFGASVVVTAARSERAFSFAAENGCGAARTNSEAADGADFVFLAVKPRLVEAVAREINGCLKESAVVISVAAGVSIASLKKFTSRPVARIMPNVCALAGESMTAVCFDDMAGEGARESVKTLLESAGRVEEIDESLMAAATAVSGSGPAYVFMFIEAMADAAVRCGLAREKALSFAAQTVKGAATMALSSGKGPAELKDSVCSPAGTTIEAVAALEKAGFRSAVMQAVKAAFDKARA